MTKAAAWLGFALLPGLLAKPAPLAGPARTIRITARKYTFLPNPIVVRQGEDVVLVVTAVDHDHGFKIRKLAINRYLKKGRPQRIALLTAQAGTYVIHCSHFCGLGHPWMKGTLIIRPRAPAGGPG